MYLYSIWNNKVDRHLVTRETECYYFDGKKKISKKTLYCKEFPWNYFLETKELKEKYDKQEKDYLERYNNALYIFRFADRVKQESIIWFIESLDKYRS